MKNCRICQQRDKLRLWRGMNDQGLAFFFLKVLVPDRLYFALIGILQRYPRSASGHPRYWFLLSQST